MVKMSQYPPWGLVRATFCFSQGTPWDEREEGEAEDEEEEEEEGTEAEEEEEDDENLRCILSAGFPQLWGPIVCNFGKAVLGCCIGSIPNLRFKV